MIKVEHTRTHKIYDGTIPPSFGSPSFREVLVTDVESVLVKDIIGGTIAKEGNGKLNIVPGAPSVPSIKQFDIAKAVLPITYFKPILISLTEKIEVGDWVYNPLAKEIVKCFANTAPLSLGCRRINGDEIWLDNSKSFKIIALPEHFSKEQLQMIVDGKLKEGKLKEGKVAVECELFITDEKDETSDMDININAYRIKLNSSNHITLHKLEEKMYSREEVSSLTHQLLTEHNNSLPDVYSQMNEKELDEYHRQWFEQNVK